MTPLEAACAAEGLALIYLAAPTSSGVPVNRIVAAGGLPERNKLLMQIYADVTNREYRIVRSALAGRAAA